MLSLVFLVAQSLFITGIYDTLLESIRRINPKLITVLKEKGIKGAFEHINGTFLIALLLVF